MKLLFKYLNILLISASIVSGVSGIEVFRHICLSHSVDDISLIEIPLCETHHNKDVVENCCGIEENVIYEHNCCQEINTFQNTNFLSISNSEDCCESFSEIKKIEEFFFPPIEKKLLFGFTQSIILQGTELSNNSSQAEFNYENKDLPPPVFGRNLLNLIHQLKIDTPIC